MTKELTYLAMNLRHQDAEEVRKSTSLPVTQTVIDSWEASEMRQLYWGKSGKPVAVVGVVPAGRGVGIPWMLGTDEIKDMPLTLYRESKTMLSRIKSRYESLQNLVDAENTVAIEWLEVLGFKFGNPVAFGPFDLPFIPFGWSR